MDNYNNLKLTKRCTILKRSVSTTGLNSTAENFILREAKSFTGNTYELKSSKLKERTHEQMHNEKESCGTQIDEPGYETRDLNSNEVYMVKDEMLSYRGKRYSVKDIATEWKKDCRMWLWKGKYKKNKSSIDLRAKLQTLKIND